MGAGPGVVLWPARCGENGLRPHYASWDWETVSTVRSFCNDLQIERWLSQEDFESAALFYTAPVVNSLVRLTSTSDGSAATCVICTTGTRRSLQRNIHTGRHWVASRKTLRN